MAKNIYEIRDYTIDSEWFEALQSMGQGSCCAMVKRKS